MSKVVFIPKANKDHRAAKGWRPINLTNRIGKLAERSLPMRCRRREVIEHVTWGFNNALDQEVICSVAGTCKKGWCRWLAHLFRRRQFEVEWDGRIRVRGSCNVNVGVPQGSPLSLVVFLIWMALILKKTEERVKKGTSLDVEIPSFINDMCIYRYCRLGGRW